MKLTVLVVDDDHDAADSLTMLLAAYGCETYTAYGGQEALQMAGIRTMELAVVDINMPGMDGYAVARQLRVSASGPELYLTAVTGAPEVETPRLAQEAGFDAHYAKPLREADVLDILSRV